WGVDFGDGVPRHPTQLYDAVFLAGLAVVLSRFAKRSHVNGDVFKLFMIGYLGFRLLVDFLKPGPKFAGLSAIRWAGVGAVIRFGRTIRRWLGEATSARLASTA